jgi:hypothetical protein
MYNITYKSINDKIIRNKNGMKFIKTSKNSYNLTFVIENKNILLSKIVDFDLINLIYTLNQDIYESVDIEKISDNESNITLVMKKIGFDLISQRYAFLNMTKYVNENTITFISNTIKTSKPQNVNDKMELITIHKIINKFEVLSPHKLDFECDIIFNEDTQIPSMADNILGIIINKIFVRVKTFIENIKYQIK